VSELGRPGRKQTDDDYAVDWLEWQNTGFLDSTCPWKNPREFRRQKHTPKSGALEKAKTS